MWQRLWRWTGLVFTLGFTLVGLTGLLMSFSWSLRLAAWLIGLFLAVLGYVLSGFLGYLPNLITILVIVIFARYQVRLIGIVFEGIRSRHIYLKNFYPEWAETSFGIVRLMIYALTAVIVFPYLPGSSSSAFRGITIGYDIPWQTVNALLVAAAQKTDGIVDTPPPFVLQTSLEDNYVACEVNGWTRTPEKLPRISGCK